MAALGIQSMFLPTSYGGASIEWVNEQPKIHMYICHWYIYLDKYLDHNKLSSYIMLPSAKIKGCHWRLAFWGSSHGDSARELLFMQDCCDYIQNKKGLRQSCINSSSCKPSKIPSICISDKCLLDILILTDFSKLVFSLLKYEAAFLSRPVGQAGSNFLSSCMKSWSSFRADEQNFQALVSY